MHSSSEFVTGDASGQFAVPRVFREVLRIHALEEAPCGGVRIGGDGGWRKKVAHGLRGAQRSSLEHRGKEAWAPVVGTCLWDASWVWYGHVSREVLVLTSEGVTNPGTDAREAVEDEPGGEEVLGGAVRVAFAGERVHEGDVIGEFGEVRDHLRDPLAGLSSLPEGVLRASEFAGGTLEGDWGAILERLSVHADEFGFVVPCLELADGACAEDHDDTVRLRGVVCGARREGMARIELRRGMGG